MISNKKKFYIFFFIVRIRYKPVFTLYFVCRIGSYDTQDVINNLVMFASLSWLEVANPSQATLWRAILYLCPAQLIR